MKCINCNGKGKTTEYDGLRKFWCDYKCEMCNGTGEVMTEQEYLQTCTTEQLAEWIADRINEVVGEALTLAWEKEGDVDFAEFEQKAYVWVEWLKQSHRNE